jgi:DNA-binding transcriptional regulator YdaS (Cro superfamily)
MEQGGADMTDVERPIERAVRLAGGQAELARRCGTSQPRIWQCLNRNLTIPAELVLKIERAVKGAVTRNELRPDLYPLGPDLYTAE